ncbi:MAG TPA: apolipoprotein N-acyltransferase [Phycisphaerae bacterium]|nr:apolipoprotein N-acyltransferase [Phycisphaerae bacterium]
MAAKAAGENGLSVRSLGVMLGAAALTVGLAVLSFAPFDAWPLAFVALVPWLIVVCSAQSARRMYVVSYLLGVAFFCTSVYWLFLVTGLGAGVLFAIFGVHFPLMACPLRHLVRRRGWRLVWVFPLVWVGSEAVRSLFLLQFPWNLLGHTQHNVLAMIQVSDLVGAYGVSFVVAAVNGALADLLLNRWGWPKAPRADFTAPGPRASLIAAGVLLAANLVYGAVQLRATRGAMRDGPKIAVLQGNYPNYVDVADHPELPTQVDRANRYFELLDAAEEDKPDLFLLPETPWYMYLNHEYLASGPGERWSQQCYDAFRERAMAYDAYIVTGSMSVDETPLDLRANERRYNSAFVFPPDGSTPARYDKIHLVMIGEYVPFRYGPLRFIYLWINRIGPFYSEDSEYSLSAGTTFTTFEMTAADGKKYGFATPICYENVMPYIARRFVLDATGHKRCDFLLNMSNDGWFLHSTELPQHLAISVFRAVENRVGMARAVNTGISCFIDPDGRIHDEVTVNGRAVGPNVDGFRVAHVQVDPQVTVYSRFGDWFAIGCAVTWGVFYLDYTLARSTRRRRRREAQA